MDTGIDLKPCPFCGGKARPRYYGRNNALYTSNVYFSSQKGIVRCDKCNAQTGVYGKMRNAVARWNTRKN